MSKKHYLMEYNSKNIKKYKGKPVHLDFIDRNGNRNIFACRINAHTDLSILFQFLPVNHANEKKSELRISYEQIINIKILKK